MSIPRKITVNCSQCGNPLAVTVFESINSDFSKDVAHQIMSGELFNVRCPHCEFTSHLEYDLLYHDMEHHAMVWVLHKKTSNYASRVNEIRSVQKLPYSTLRIVSDMNELKEKVSCLEYGRDDRVIELCKVFSVYNFLLQRPDYSVSNAFYTAVSGREIIYIYDDKGNNVFSELPEQIYDYLKKLYYSSPYSQQFDNNYALVDYSWAEKIFNDLIEWEKRRNNSPSSTDKAHGVVTASEKLICPECTSELPGDSEFCPKCGIKLSGVFTANANNQKKQEYGKKVQADVDYENDENECENVVQKRLVAAKTAEKQSKKKRLIIILIIAVLLIILMVKESREHAYLSESRNMVTEEMDEKFTNVYADVISIEPEYFVYQYRTTSSGTIISSGHLSEVVCRCVTIEGETIWASFFYQYYPEGKSSMNESNYKPMRYAKDSPMRLIGSIDTAHQVVNQLENAIGNVFVLDVRELSVMN